MMWMLGLYKNKNVRGDWRLPYDFVYGFQVENLLNGKTKNIEYHWHYGSYFLQSFIMYLEKKWIIKKATEVILAS